MKARLIVATAALALCAPAQAAPPGSTFLVTRPTGFGPLTVGFTNDSWTGTSPDSSTERGGRRLASANGRFVVFRVAFTGRIGRRALRAGRYRVTARAVDEVGNRSLPRSAPFRVVAGG